MAQLNEVVLDEIDVFVRSAFWDADVILEIMCEELYAPGDLDENAVRIAIAESIEQWHASQAVWPEVTDCDRLDQAFSKLNEMGIVALQNAGNTQSDGYEDFREIYNNHPNQRKLVGYCFYHGQDLERVVRGGPLVIAFGPCDPKLEESEGPRIGLMITQELKQVGLEVAWDGTFNRRIEVPTLKWQRRALPK